MKIGYNRVEDFEAYCERHEIELKRPAATLLALGLAYVDKQPYLGEPTGAEQPNAWPRKNVWIDGSNICSGSAPDAVREAQIAAALIHNKGNKSFSSVDKLLAPYLVQDVHD